MGIRLTRCPGQAGTNKSTERYRERLARVRYRYDEANACPHAALYE
jgi:hypothetical protein